MNTISKLIGLSSLSLTLGLTSTVNADYCEWPDGVWRECVPGMQTNKHVESDQGTNSGRDIRSNAIGDASQISNTAVIVVFKQERTEFKNGYIYIWGSVTNEGDSTIEFLKVRFTITTSTGEFITREAVYTDPHDIAPGQTGYIDGRRFDCNGLIPKNITWETSFR